MSNNNIDFKQFLNRNTTQPLDARLVDNIKTIEATSNSDDQTMVTSLKLKSVEKKNLIDLGAISYQKRAEQNKTYGKAKDIPPNIVEEVRSYLIGDHQKILQESFMNNSKRTILSSIVTRYITKRKIVVPGYSATQLQTKILDAVAGLGPLQPLSDDQDITEIMVNGKDEVIIEKFGKEIKTDIKFASIEELDEVTMKIVNASGMTLTSSKPYVDCRFPSMRINIVNGLISGLGTVITIRKFAPVLRISKDTMIESGQASEEMVNLLEALMRGRQNVLIVGPTGSGKTELLKYMVGDIPDSDRTLVLEDTAETYLRNIYPNKHIIPMECRFTDDEETTIDYEVLLTNVLRQNPNRIIVGESRGPEALLMLEILNTGHPGASTAHSNSAHDAVDRLIMMCLRAGIKLDREIIGKWVTKIFDVIIFQRKMDDGVRRIAEIIEVKDYVNDDLIYTPLYEFEEHNVELQDGVVKSIEGEHVRKGYLSTKKVRDILKLGVEKDKIYDLISVEDKEMLKL
ncbi:CpaF family protein [Viridibacillus arvi]|uniref:CpaF family protein n=1 Tax=Viridibacillus arvi TaxID=263475 RepID=UPI0034CEB572